MKMTKTDNFCEEAEVKRTDGPRGRCGCYETRLRLCVTGVAREKRMGEGGEIRVGRLRWRSVAVSSKQNQGGSVWGTENRVRSLEKWTLSDLGVRRGDGPKLQCFRVRAGVFASAHGRPDGMPGRSIGARAKALQWRGRVGGGRGLKI